MFIFHIDHFIRWKNRQVSFFFIFSNQLSVEICLIQKIKKFPYCTKSFKMIYCLALLKIPGIPVWKLAGILCRVFYEGGYNVFSVLGNAKHNMFLHCKVI